MQRTPLWDGNQTDPADCMVIMPDDVVVLDIGPFKTRIEGNRFLRHHE